MQQIVINKKGGGIDLSKEGIDLYQKLSGITFEEDEDDDKEWVQYDYFSHLERDNKDLVEVIKTLNQKANGEFANLKIVEIPDNVEWQIEYADDGFGTEWVAEKHKIWE